LKLFQEWGRGMKESSGGGEFNYHIFVRTFVNTPIYSTNTAIIKKNLTT
jgi:hypothetical protein